MTTATQPRPAFLRRWLWSGALLLAVTGVLWLTPAVQEFDRRIQDSFLRLQSSSGPSTSTTAASGSSDVGRGRDPLWPLSFVTFLASNRA